jgi:hypothetical protein
MDSDILLNGKSEITNYIVKIEIPEEIIQTGYDFNIMTNIIYDNKKKSWENFDIKLLTSEIIDNSFFVYSNSNCKFFWTLIGKKK